MPDGRQGGMERQAKTAGEGAKVQLKFRGGKHLAGCLPRLSVLGGRCSVRFAEVGGFMCSDLREMCGCAEDVPGMGTRVAGIMGLVRELTLDEVDGP